MEPKKKEIRIIIPLWYKTFFLTKFCTWTTFMGGGAIGGLWRMAILDFTKN